MGRGNGLAQHLGSGGLHWQESMMSVVDKAEPDNDKTAWRRPSSSVIEKALILPVKSALWSTSLKHLYTNACIQHGTKTGIIGSVCVQLQGYNLTGIKEMWYHFRKIR